MRIESPPFLSLLNVISPVFVLLMSLHKVKKSIMDECDIVANYMINSPDIEEELINLVSPTSDYGSWTEDGIPQDILPNERLSEMAPVNSNDVPVKEQSPGFQNVCWTDEGFVQEGDNSNDVPVKEQSPGFQNVCWTDEGYVQEGDCFNSNTIDEVLDKNYTTPESRETFTDDGINQEDTFAFLEKLMPFDEPVQIKAPNCTEDTLDVNDNSSSLCKGKAEDQELPGDERACKKSSKPTTGGGSTKSIVEWTYEQLDNDRAENYICWLNKRKGIYMIKDQHRLAEEWGKYKKNPKMSYTNYA